MNKQKKLDKIEKEIHQLEHDLVNSYRNGLRYNTAQKEKIDKEKDFKSWLRYQNKIQFYKELVEKTEVQIKRLKLEWDNLELDLKEEDYKNKLKAFDGLMATHLTNLIENLNNILEEKPFSSTIANRIYDSYVKNSVGIKKIDLFPFENFNLSSVNLRYSLILEWVANVAKSDPSIKAGLKIDKVDKFASLMRTLAVSCLNEIKKRNPKTLTEKLAGAFKHGS